MLHEELCAEPGQASGSFISELLSRDVNKYIF